MKKIYYKSIFIIDTKAQEITTIAVTGSLFFSLNKFTDWEQRLYELFPDLKIERLSNCAIYSAQDDFWIRCTGFKKEMVSHPNLIILYITKHKNVDLASDHGHQIFKNNSSHLFVKQSEMKCFFIRDTMSDIDYRMTTSEDVNESIITNSTCVLIKETKDVCGIKTFIAYVVPELKDLIKTTGEFKDKHITLLSYCKRIKSIDEFIGSELSTTTSADIYSVPVAEETYSITYQTEYPGTFLLTEETKPEIDNNLHIPAQAIFILPKNEIDVLVFLDTQGIWLYEMCKQGLNKFKIKEKYKKDFDEIPEFAIITEFKIGCGAYPKISGEVTAGVCFKGYNDLNQNISSGEYFWNYEYFEEHFELIQNAKKPETKTSYTTGIKFDSEKPDWSLIPYDAMEEVVHILTFGVKKYERDNWKHVEPYRERYFAAAMRHMTAWYNGESIDPESNRHHIAHAICCLLFILWKSMKEGE